MTAGLSTRGHDASAYTITDLPTTAPLSTAPPSRGFTVPTTAPFGFASYGLDRRAAPAEGDNDARTLIDNLVAGAVGGDVRARDDLLALIHPLVLKFSDPNASDRGMKLNAYAYGISFPGTAETRRIRATVQYQVNPIWWQAYYGDDLGDEGDLVDEEYDA